MMEIACLETNRAELSLIFQSLNPWSLLYLLARLVNFNFYDSRRLSHYFLFWFVFGCCHLARIVLWLHLVGKILFK